MHLSDILTADNVKMSVAATSKKRLLETMSDLFAHQSDNISQEEIFDALLNRERLGSTGIGAGVAIPHTRLAKLQETVACLLVLDEPIDFDAIDEQAVDIVFGLLVPENATNDHLQLLAAIAEMCHSVEVLSAVRSADSVATLYSLLTKDGVF